MRGLLLRVLVAAVAALLWPVMAWAQASEHVRPVRTVLTIHLGAEAFPANPILDSAIREALQSRARVPIDYYAEYLETDGVPLGEAETALAGYIRDKYRGRHIDLVIAMTDTSLQFVMRRRSDLFSDAPIVFAGAVAPDSAVRTGGRGVTGVVVSNAYGETLRLALHLHPRIKQVYVIARSPNEQTVEPVRAQLRQFSDDTNIVYVNEDTLPKLLAAVKRIPPGNLILYVWHSQDEPGNVIYPHRIARLVSEAATVPVYGTSDFYVGLGVIGGVVRRTAETGARVGQLAAQILNGTRAQDLPIETARVVPTFDWRQVRRWGIDVSDLPPLSDVQFKVPTAWESYRGYIVAAILVFVSQLLLIAGLLAQRARRRRAEQTIRQREAKLRKSYERIRQLARGLIHAQEAARMGIARDLHDGICQDLVGASLAITTLKSSSGDLQDPSTQQALLHMQGEMHRMHQEIRRISHQLHPSTLALVGVGPALKAHCAEVERRHAVDVTFSTEGELGDIDPETAVSLFRIAQESLRNGLSHGQARKFAVTLTRSPEHVELVVTDDGLGFDADSVRRTGRGLGLVSIEERAHMVGGEVQIGTARERGTTIRVSVPVAAGSESAEDREQAV